MTRPKIAFATHELWPFVQGGGIGRSIWAVATVMARHADVTVITTDAAEPAYRELDPDDPRALPGVRMVFAREPGDEISALRTYHHRWSLALLDALRAAYPERGPDLVEFNDYWGEGAMTIEARRGGDPWLAGTTVAVRTRTTHELTTALNGGELGDFERVLHGLERSSLRGADVVLWPGGDVWGTYERFYGAAALAPARLVRQAFSIPPPDPADRDVPPGPELRLLYFGRLERRKGVEALVRAVLAAKPGTASLTLVGGDTDSAPGGGSMRAHLAELAGGDPRVAFRDRVAHEELAPIVRAHHVVVSPSRWESWSNVVREALAWNRPVLSTPVGGVIAAIQPGRTGWLTAGTDVADLEAGIAALVERREEIERMIAAGTPRAGLEEQLDDDGIAAALLELAASGDRGSAPAPPAPAAITALVAWDGGEGALERTLASLRACTVPVRVVLAASEGLPPLRLGAQLAEVVIAAPGTPTLARALRHARGEHPVLLLAAGQAVLPGFLPRALAALAADPALAYAGALPEGWGRAALPNAAAAVLGAAVGGGPLLVRRADAEALRDAEPAADPAGALAAALAQRERWGCILPEPLVRDAPPAWPPAAAEAPVAAELAPAEVWRAPAAVLPGGALVG
jgi:glycosyltransferase involved in cell wall biosynthesis